MILEDVIEEHLDEACFLWQRRQSLLASLSHGVDTQRNTERRLLAHLDGLIIGGREAWTLLKPRLAADENGATVASWVALESGDPVLIEQLLPQLPLSSPALRMGVLHALRHCAGPSLDGLLYPWLDAAHWRLRCLSVDALSFRRRTIEPAVVAPLLSDHSPEVRAAAAYAAGRLRLSALCAALVPLFEDEEPKVRAAAWWAGLLLGSEGVLPACRRVVAHRQSDADRGLFLLGVAGDPADLELLAASAADPGLGRAGVLALGSAGHAVAVPHLLSLTGVPSLARVAGVALQRITGVDLVRAQLTAKTPPVVAPDAGLDDYQDAALPLPDAEKLGSWWTGESGRFRSGQRYCWGSPFGTEALRPRYATAALALRSELSYALALSLPGGPVPESEAFLGTTN